MGSKFQRILWSVAGAELDILEKCRTDHKRFAAIGATILMTTFIAFCAGTSAALYFTQSGNETSGSWGWAILFGLIWALLIFCIDRNLVITLKKDPSVKKQKIWVPLLSRSALACIIAFMVVWFGDYKILVNLTPRGIIYKLGSFYFEHLRDMVAEAITGKIHKTKREEMEKYPDCYIWTIGCAE